ncbi:MAG TPA: hypothetical protein VFJ07_17145 [Streptosporangiaceae bacterium]|nr:hypothetical protein [Streptosporangiaceae bacterium]
MRSAADWAVPLIEQFSRHGHDCPAGIDDPSDSTVNGTQQQIWSCNTNPQQNWTLP